MTDVELSPLDELKLARLAAIRQLYARQNEAAKARVEHYMHDAAAWAQDHIDWPEGETLAPYQADTLRQIVPRKRVAVRGPHGLGKSTMMAITVLWFACTREAAGRDWKVITTASVWRQLSVYLWPEIHKWAARLKWKLIGREPFNRNELLALNLKLRHGAATAVASNVPERIEGAHADSILYVLDEAKIIPPGTWDAIEGALSNDGVDGGKEAYIVAMSTPGPPAGRFYQIHKRESGYEDWCPRHVTLDEAIDARRISQEWADQRRHQWGENSALYQGRVLGNFHADDEQSVIPLAWLEAAIERWHQWDADGRPMPEEPVKGWVGIDVGRGGDETVLAKRLGPALILSANRSRDTMTTAALAQSTGLRPIVDVIGVGAGVYDRLKEIGAKPLAYTGSGKSTLRDRSRQFGFVNVRSAAYWRLRELLDPDQEPNLALPPDDLMLSDLTTPQWEVTTGDPPKIKITNKDVVVEKLGRSPDRGDAVVMALWADAVRSPTQVAQPQGTIQRTGLSPLG